MMGSNASGTDNEKDLKVPYDGRQTHKVAATDVDVAAHLALSPGEEFDPAEALRIRKKIDRHIMPMMCLLYGVQFMDKTTLGNAAILGIRQDNHLTATHNLLSTVFYISYFVFQYPHSLALQALPVGKWMSANIFVWAIALSTHAACTNFGGLFAVRFILGMCEGSITAGFMLVTSMFYTRAEQSKRVGYWFLMNGLAAIISGFISFGVLHIKKTALHPWQWFMIITGIVTLILAVCFWFLFPDSPANAWFLTHEEKKIAAERIKINQTGFENKHFKKEQFNEALKDPKTWLFALFSIIENIPNALTNQIQITISSFGFSIINTTLLGSVVGVVEIAAIWGGVILAGRFTNARAYVGALCFIPCVLGSLLVICLPQKDRVGLLFGVWLASISQVGFVLSLGWVTAVTAGHTKRITVNAIMLTAYAAGNAAGPQMFLAKYAPRNRVPWIVILVCYSVAPFILLWIRVLLSTENKRRDAEATNISRDSQDDVYLEETLADGTMVQRKVDKAFLDLTDKQNRDFRYVL